MVLTTKGFNTFKSFGIQTQQSEHFKNKDEHFKNEEHTLCAWMNMT